MKRLLLFLLIFFPSLLKADQSCDSNVCVTIQDKTFPIRITVQNNRVTPIYLNFLSTEMQNLQVLPSANFSAVIGAGEQKYIGQMQIQQRGQRYSYRYRWTFVTGSPEAKHNPRYAYSMPFGGNEKRLLSQGNNGTFSHQGKYRYAFDFTMPIGTPVLAARDGIVSEVIDGFTYGANDRALIDKANLVSIYHSDGTFADYVHLNKGILVKVGQQIRRGQILAYSGNTGFTTKPHLHFQVWQRQKDAQSVSIPILFSTYSQRDFVPQEGGYYEPSLQY